MTTDGRIVVMVTGAGGSAAIGFCRSLRAADPRYRLVGVDCDKYHLQLAETDFRYLIPPASDPDYLPILNLLADRHGAHLLHAQPDPEVAFLSEHRQALRVRTAFPEARTVRRCLDKFESYRLWRGAGIRVPETLRIDDPDDLRTAFESFGPCIWLRNSQGAAGRGALPTADFEQAAAWIDFCRGWGDFTAAACLSYESVTWQSIWEKGELLVAQGRLRKYWEFGNRSPSGVTGLTGTGVTLSDPALDELAVRCILAVDAAPDGIYSVDLTYDHDGMPNPTEINIGRFFTTHDFFSRAGLNFPDIFVKRALGIDVRLPNVRFNPLPDGLAWVRGLDSEPVLTTERDIDASEQVLAGLRENIREQHRERSLQTFG